MSDTSPPAHAPSSIALFRYATISQVHALVLAGRTASRSVREVAARDHAHPARGCVRVTVRTVQRWMSAHKRDGLAGLEPTSRRRTTTSEALSAELVEFFREEKIRDPRASVPELIRRARVRGVIRVDLPVDRTTAWRACVRMNLPTRYRPSRRELDSRRWRLPAPARR